MSITTDMSIPVTRGELREDLQQLRMETATKAELQQAIEPLATKRDLEFWGGALLARIESGERKLNDRIERLEQRFQNDLKGLEQRVGERFIRLEERSARLEERLVSLEGRFVGLEERFTGLERRFMGLEERLGNQLERHAKAIHESVASLIAGVTISTRGGPDA